jgi:hypothetical protein
MKAADEAVTDAKGKAQDAARAVQTAKAMPSGTPEEIRLRDEAIRQATEASSKAQEVQKAAEARERALLGTRMLTEALEHGPLSAEAGKPFPDDVAEKFMQGFALDPQLTGTAITSAKGSRNPGAVAKYLGPMIDKMNKGFADKTGTPLPPSIDSRAYAEKMLAIGAHCGDAYFAGLDDYIANGGPRAPAPFGEATGDKASVRSQKRTVALAGGLLSPSGAVDLTTDRAKTALGNILYHPEAMANPQPALTDQVLKSVDLFNDPVHGPKANNLLKGVTKPVTGGGAEKLVSRALGKTGEVTPEEARQVALAAFLKPLDQGPVGSCFSTAPCRRMRETQPLDALKNYTDIAGKGTLSTAKPPPVPVVTNIPPGEDPIMRTMEYTLATAMARESGSIQMKTVQGLSGNGVLAMENEVRTALGKGPTEDVGPQLFQAYDSIVKAFEVEYNPVVSLGGVSTDGSSSEGRYVIKRKSDKVEITSETDYRATIEPLILGALGLDPTSPEAIALVPAIQTKLIAEIKKKSVQPWKLASGGETAEATGELFGAHDESVTNTKNGSPSDTRQKQGTRTIQVMENLLAGFGSSPPDMMTMKTQSIHGFNALPNNPTLKPLLEGPGSMSDKLKAALTDPGKKIAETKLAPERAAWHFDKAVAENRKFVDGWVKNAASPTERSQLESLRTQFDDKAKTLRPTVEMTPKEIRDLVQQLRSGLFNHPEKCDDPVTGGFLDDLDVPQIVIADSNWGTGMDHTYFVVAPDPLTGQPLLWQKVEPPGTMTILDPKWIDDTWAVLKPKTDP